MELMIIPGAIVLFMLTWAAAEMAVLAATTMRKPRLEPACDMPPLEAKRNPWFSVWA